MNQMEKPMNKSLYFNTPFKVKSSEEEGEQPLRIEGYASTSAIDRHGDVVEASAWKNPKAMENYINNPIILAYHDHTKPIGKMVDYETDSKGLRIVAEISKAAGEIYDLVKDGVLRTFSIGFMVKDADWDEKKDVFRIKDVELFETSVVSVPANATAGFDIAKSFENDEDFTTFKQQFVKSNLNGDDKMSNENTAPQGLSAEEVAEIVAKQMAEQEARKAEEAKREKEIEDRVSGAVTDAVDRLQADMAKKLDEASRSEEKLQATVAELAGQVKEKGEELEAARKRKMEWNGTSAEGIANEERDTAVLLAKCLGTSVENTKYGQGIIAKAGANHPSAISSVDGWETEFSMNVLADLRQELKIEPVMRKIAMSTPTLHIPVNPEAGYADWVTGGKGAAQDQRSVPNQNPDTRTGSAVDQQLRSISLTSKTLATKSYIGYEEEEDSMIPVMPLVRDALIRRMAQASDLCLMMGQSASATGMTGVGSGTSIEGLWDFKTSSVTSTDNGATTAVADETLTIEDMLNARKALLRHGLDTSKLAYFTDVKGYYELLTDADATGNVTFQTMDKVGSVATLLTGQLGSIGGVPLIVSEAFPAHTANSAMACCVYLPNFLFGEQRGLRVEQSIDVEFQTKTLVATRRFDFQEIETNKGVHFIVHGAS